MRGARKFLGLCRIVSSVAATRVVVGGGRVGARQPAFVAFVSFVGTRE